MLSRHNQRDHWPKSRLAVETDELYRELTGNDPPAVDRQTYNYGRCLPWARLGANAEYLRTQSLYEAMSDRAHRLSQATWELSEALRRVRHADTLPEYYEATAALKAARVAYDLLGIDSTYNSANMPNEPEDYIYGENI